MALRVFVSHAIGNDELPIVHHLAAALLGVGVEAYLGVYDREPGSPLGAKIQRSIDASDLVVVLLTKKGVESAWVNQEVGYAIGRGKKVLPFVEKGLDTEGMLHGVEYFVFDPAKPVDQVATMTNYLSYLNSQKQLDETRQALELAQADAERNAEIAAAVVGVGLILLLIWALSRK
jgi:hypothetical protein